MFTHWLVVADGRTARAYEVDEWMEEVHPAWELHEDDGDVVTVQGEDRRRAPLPPDRGRSDDPQRTRERRFARAVADRLDRGHADGAFERLILVAPPRCLGDLRACLDARLDDALFASIDQDWTRCTTAETFARVRDHLARQERIHGD